MRRIQKQNGLFRPRLPFDSSRLEVGLGRRKTTLEGSLHRGRLGDSRSKVQKTHESLDLQCIRWIDSISNVSRAKSGDTPPSRKLLSVGVTVIMGELSFEHGVTATRNFATASSMASLFLTPRTRS